jgi:hypothetical protein
MGLICVQMSGPAADLERWDDLRSGPRDTDWHGRIIDGTVDELGDSQAGNSPCASSCLLRFSRREGASERVVA